MQRSTIFGILIVIFGVIVLIDLFAKFIDIELLVAWWPIIFVCIGFALISSPGSKTIWMGTALLLGGALAIAERVGVLTGDFRPIIIGMVVLLIGLVIVTPTVTSQKVD